MIRKSLLVLAMLLAIPLAGAAETAQVSKGDSLREKPFADAKVLTNLTAGQKVDILKREGAWYQVKADGKTGWVRMLSLRRTGQAAAAHAGPAIVISMVIAGLVSALAALCYSEFAASVPIAGSAYTYAYATLGEFIAWVIGWDLILEYALGAATVAVGWSGNLMTLLRQFDIQFPAALSAAPGTPVAVIGSETVTAVFNLPAVIIAALVTTLLVIGIKELAMVNNIVVVIKVSVVAMVIAAGAITTNTATNTGTEFSTTGGLRLDAQGGGIGTTGNRIDTNVGTLAARVNGSLFLDEQNGLILGAIPALDSQTPAVLSGIDATTNVTISTGGVVTQTAPITATRLVLQGTGSYVLNLDTNDVDIIAAVGPSGVDYRAGSALTAGTVGPTVGMNVAGDIQLATRNGGALIIDSPVTTIASGIVRAGERTSSASVAIRP